MFQLRTTFYPSSDMVLILIVKLIIYMFLIDTKIHSKRKKMNGGRRKYVHDLLYQDDNSLKKISKSCRPLLGNQNNKKISRKVVRWVAKCSFGSSSSRRGGKRKKSLHKMILLNKSIGMRIQILYGSSRTSLDMKVFSPKIIPVIKDLG